MKYIAMSFWYQPEDNDHSFLFAYVFFITSGKQVMPLVAFTCI